MKTLYFSQKQITKNFSQTSNTDLPHYQTKHDTERAPASVNREFELLSPIFTLAIDVGKADSNPCARVKKFELDNERYRYLDASEETALMAALVSRRAHLHSMVIIALGLGLREARAVEFEARPNRLFLQCRDCQPNEGKTESGDTNGRIGRARKIDSNVALWNKSFLMQKLLHLWTAFWKRPAHLGRACRSWYATPSSFAWRFSGTIRSHHANVPAQEMHCRLTRASQAIALENRHQRRTSLNLQN